MRTESGFDAETETPPEDGASTSAHGVDPSPSPSPSSLTLDAFWESAPYAVRYIAAGVAHAVETQAGVNFWDYLLGVLAADKRYRIAFDTALTAYYAETGEALHVQPRR